VKAKSSSEWIGYTLGLSLSTVAEHLQLVQRKLGVRSRTELILGRGA
jgi:DNA-binding CsgD family transcriptional regulator